jgi:hypothetical protein
MPTIWDLLPASLWPTQPFIPPSDPTQPPPWPQASPPNWNPSAPSLSSFGWPTPSGLTDMLPDHDFRDMSYYDRMLADAKRAHDFAMWAFGPGGAQPTPPKTTGPRSGVAAPKDGQQYPESYRPLTSTINQGLPSAGFVQAPGKDTTPQEDGRWTPEQRAQYCALSAATIAANFGNALQRSLGQTDPATNQVITQDWINRQVTQMETMVEQIQRQLGCPPEAY